MELIKRIEECLDNGWAVDAEDIRALVEAYKAVPEILEQSLGLGNRYIIKPYDGRYWIEHSVIGSGEPLKQWIENELQEIQ